MQSVFSWAPKVARKCESKHWYACGADGRSVYGHVITKFSRMGSLPHFLTHGAPQARFARQSSAINPLLTKLARSRWLEFGLVRFSSRSINTKKKLGQYPAILTSRKFLFIQNGYHESFTQVSFSSRPASLEVVSVYKRTDNIPLYFSLASHAGFVRASSRFLSFENRTLQRLPVVSSN